jgi:Fic family protein
MDLDRFRHSPVGRLVPTRVVDGETVYNHEAFVPASLPDAVQLEDSTWAKVAAATGAVARLDGAAHRLPNPYLLVRPSLAEEAVSTSALEGTYAPLEDVLQAEFLDEAHLSSETVEVRNYILAAERGLELIKELPICHRLIKEVHGILMHNARGDYAEAGQYRRRQNWIGPRRGSPITESFFVPPPPGELLDTGLDQWEAWLNRKDDLPVLIRAALGHYQFETLHPFIDGNGRVGRLLVILSLIASGELRIPLLNISPYLEHHRDEYIDHIRGVSETGDFDRWVAFFADAVQVQAERALSKADRLVAKRDEIVRRLHEANVRGVAIRIAEDLVGYPVLTPTSAAEKFDVSFQAANTAIARLVDHGVLREITGRSYGRMFVAPDIMGISLE